MDDHWFRLGDHGRYLPSSWTGEILRKLLVFGNSGSGKSTLAKSLAASEGLIHFDLDSIAWLATDPPERASLVDSSDEIGKFVSDHSNWVVEGCYADLIKLLVPYATEMIFLNLSVDDCISNARKRPWEPHKYPTKELQDSNLEMLEEWIRDYPQRDDVCSLGAHKKLFEDFEGLKTMVTENAGGR